MELWIGHFRMKIQLVPRGGILVHFSCLKLVFPKNITTTGTLAKVTLSLSNVVIKGLETHSNNIPLEASLESIAAWMNFVPG